MTAETKGAKEIELRSDAWERFEQAIDVVAKSPPQPRKKSDKALSRGRPSRPRAASSKPENA